MTTSWIPLINIFYSPFLWTFIYLAIFHSVSISTSLFCLWAFMLLHAFIKLHVWLILICVWCLTCWLWPTNFTSVNVLGITSVSYLQGWFILICVWCVICWPLSKNYSHTPIHCMNPFSSKLGIDSSVRSYYLKHYLCWFIHDMIIPNACVSWYDVLNGFGILFLWSCWIQYIVS